MIDFVSSFPNGELDSISNYEKVILVAIDTEYTRLDDMRNLCLSYQFAGLNLYSGKYATKIIYPDYKTEVRLTLKEIFLAIFKMLDIKRENINAYHIILVCHFCVAEWAMLRDRKDIVKYFEFLYKTVITFKEKGVSFSIDEIEYNITFELGDTMLLLPPSHRSLQKASSLLDEKYHKKELSEAEKSDMLTLLKQDKRRFEEYALHDAEITLRLFIKLQYFLNSINETTNKRYTTIGNATVKHFQKFIKENFKKGMFKSQFSPKNEIYQQGLDLAKRSYMGGLNSSYFVGEEEGELFLDIDFSSAYPTVMNMLQIGDFGEEIVYKKNNPKEFTLGDLND